MNKLHAEKVQAILLRMTDYQKQFVAKFGGGPAPGGSQGAYNAQFALGMMEAAKDLWSQGLAGVTLPLDLSGVDYTSGVFASYGEELNRADFKRAKLDRTRWFGLHVKHADFSGASLREAFAAAMCCEGSIFRGADLSGARLGLIAVDAPVDFSGANLSGAEFIISYPTPLILTDARLEGARVTTGEIGPGTKEGVDAFLASLSETQRRQVRVEVTEEQLAKSLKMRADLAASAGKKGGCFIATAACGSEGDVDVLRLRAFRERVLRPGPAGRAFIRLYERLSPPVADWIRVRPGFRRFVRRWLVRPASRLFGPRSSG